MGKEKIKISCPLTSVSCLLTSVFCLLCLSSFATFDFTPNCQQAMQEILDLRTQTARETLSSEKIHHPDNGYVIYLELLSDVIELLITDEEARYDRLMDIYETRFAAMDKLDDGSPYNSLLQAEMLFYVGLSQVKFGSNFNGASKIYNSYISVKDHRDDNPDFYLNLKMTGMYNIMMDFIPQSMRWITGILGVSGDAELGMKQLNEYFSRVKDTPGLAEESVLILNLAYKLTWKDEEGFKFLSGLDKSLCNNTLSYYLCAVSASFSFQNDMALEKLSHINRDKLQVPFYTLDYLTGRCQLNRLDPGANVPLERFLKNYPGNDFKKDACNRLSFHYLLQGNISKYSEYKSMVASVGQEIRDRDLEAIKESTSPIIPHTGLLKARLLFDGGYFQKADSVMTEIPPATLNLTPYKLEYLYRRGRIDQMLGRSDHALAELKKTVADGAGQPYTFATRAALQIAIIYEENEDYLNALHWYKECLKYYDESHTVGSVEDKAEKGRRRMEKMLKI